MNLNDGLMFAAGVNATCVIAYAAHGNYPWLVVSLVLLAAAIGLRLVDNREGR